jgi:hypothetical protein
MEGKLEDSSVSVYFLVKTWTSLSLGYGVSKYGSGVRFPAGVRDFSLIQ